MFNVYWLGRLRGATVTDNTEIQYVLQLFSSAKNMYFNRESSEEYIAGMFFPLCWPVSLKLMTK